MFEELQRPRTRAASRRGLFLLGSSALEAAVVAAVFAIAARRALPPPEPPVNVVFPGFAPPKQPAATPGDAPPARRPARRPPHTPRHGLLVPPVAAPLPLDTPALQLDVPAPDFSAPAGFGTGLAPNGCAGPRCGAEEGLPIGGRLDSGEQLETVQTPTFGFVPPHERERGCVAAQVRLPAELNGYAGKATIKFAVDRDGSTGLLRFLTRGVDPRVEQAVRAAVNACVFEPGLDPQHQPQRIWIVLTLRFEAR